MISSRKLLLLLVFICSINVILSTTTIIANVYYSRISGKYSVQTSDKRDPMAVASAVYTDSYEEKGWDFLALSSYQGEDSKFQDYIKSYGMGYLEGVITYKRIYPFFENMKHFHFHKNNAEMPDITKKFVLQNLEYMKTTAIEKKDKDPYWDQVYNFYKQMQGLIDGYNSKADNDHKISYVDFQVMNAVSDVDEMEYWDKTARPDFSKMSTEEIIDYVETHTHCSALMKVAPDFSNVWFGHNTWTSYNKMNRIFKEYKFKTNSKVEKSTTVAFSGYPGVLASIDDFYLLDNDLYVTETTNTVFNQKLYDNLKPQCLLSWIRTLLANRLSSTGKEWVEIFGKENSGTYNNQFQVLDLKKIDLTNRKIEEGALYVLEQIPGAVQYDDLTDVLKKGYWPSYNSAYFPFIREQSGYLTNVTTPELKDIYDYQASARANIFRRDQTKVVDNESYQKLIRYNDYMNEPLSKKNPALTIGARKDLVEADDKKMCYGLIDAKYVNLAEIKGKTQKKIHIISGPTNDDQETFNWKTTKCIDANPIRWTYYGQPEEWNFPWIEYETTLFES